MLRNVSSAAVLATKQYQVQWLDPSIRAETAESACGAVLCVCVMCGCQPIWLEANQMSSLNILFVFWCWKLELNDTDIIAAVATATLYWLLNLKVETGLESGAIAINAEFAKFAVATTHPIGETPRVAFVLRLNRVNGWNSDEQYSWKNAIKRWIFRNGAKEVQCEPKQKQKN